MKKRLKKILVVEDSKQFRENLVSLLEINNYSTVEAVDGYVGYSKAVDELPDLIIADIMMPVMDGYELLKKIRSFDLTSTTPFVFLTAKTSPTEIKRGIDLGADAYITKPYNSGRLIKTITSVFEKSKRVSVS